MANCSIGSFLPGASHEASKNSKRRFWTGSTKSFRFNGSSISTNENLRCAVVIYSSSFSSSCFDLSYFTVTLGKKLTRIVFS